MESNQTRCYRCVGEVNIIEDLQQDTDPKDLFAFKINYDKQPGNSQIQALYNGNISETYWKTGTDLAKRSYGYQYDNLNRLTSAIYSKPNDAIPVSGAYNESLSYDKNGNIKSLQRYGASDAPSIVFQIDDLTYGYLDQNSNQLTKVTDGPAGNDNEGFKDANKTGDDFTYDLNGNMIADKNKNITAIQYNQLNLPSKITFGTNGTIEYIYNATGQKLEKIVKEASSITHTEYLTGFQYSYVISDGYVPDDPGNTDPPIDGTDPVIDPPVEANRSGQQLASMNVPSQPMLQFFPTAEGYYDDIYKKYVYQYKDHLGNIRLSYAKNPVTQVLEIIEENNYYPFGLKHTGYNDYVASNNKYKYNGQEFQDELQLNMTAMDYRQYDNSLGRFNSIDALSEMSYSISPFAFSYNNPVFWSDPTGLLSQAFVTSLWENSTDGKDTNWLNDGGGTFSNEDASGMIDQVTGEFTGFDSLKEVTISGKKTSGGGSHLEGNIGGLAQSKAYSFGKFYESWRSDFRTKQFDDTQDFLSGLGTFDPTGAVDGINALGYLLRGQTGNAAIAAIAIIPYVGDAAKGIKLGYKGTSIATRSALAARIGKRGYTEVGYQFSKHAGRVNGSAWKNIIPAGTTLNPNAWNKYGYDVYKEIMRSPGSIEKVGGFLEKRLPDGRGIRLQDNFKFKGFLD